jgi:hypothetical protein
MTRLSNLVLFLLAMAGSVVADHDTGATWSWHVVSGGLDESRVAIFNRQEMIGIFDFSCDLTAAGEGDMSETDASLNLVQPESNPEGLLVVTCNVGAHSQYIAIVDPTSKSNQPVFAETGSYFVKWELEDGELWISYDHPCATGVSVECPDGFETVFVQYPAPQ